MDIWLRLHTLSQIASHPTQEHDVEKERILVVTKKNCTFNTSYYMNLLLDDRHFLGPRDESFTFSADHQTTGNWEVEASKGL